MNFISAHSSADVSFFLEGEANVLSHHKERGRGHVRDT